MRPPRSRRTILAPPFVVLAVLGTWSAIRPSNDREWAVGLDVLPQVTLDGDVAIIEGVHKFRWRSFEDFDPTDEPGRVPR